MKKKLVTPTSKIVSALRRSWEYSRERHKALKDAGYCCAKCLKKQSRKKGSEVKIEVHHKHQPNWQRIISVLREELFHNADAYIVLCKECHRKEHSNG